VQQASELWDDPCYAIGVAAEMVSLHPQTLRRYEEFGLVVPARRAGRRRYSPRDIERLQHISSLSNELGLNLAGVEVIIRLNTRVDEMQAELEELRTDRMRQEAQIAALQAELCRRDAPAHTHREHTGAPAPVTVSGAIETPTQ